MGNVVLYADLRVSLVSSFVVSDYTDALRHDECENKPTDAVCHAAIYKLQHVCGINHVSIHMCAH